MEHGIITHESLVALSGAGLTTRAFTEGFSEVVLTHAKRASERPLKLGVVGLMIPEWLHPSSLLTTIICQSSEKLLNSLTRHRSCRLPDVGVIEQEELKSRSVARTREGSSSVQWDRPVQQVENRCPQSRSPAPGVEGLISLMVWRSKQKSDQQKSEPHGDSPSFDASGRRITENPGGSQLPAAASRPQVVACRLQFHQPRGLPVERSIAKVSHIDVFLSRTVHGLPLEIQGSSSTPETRNFGGQAVHIVAFGPGVLFGHWKKAREVRPGLNEGHLSLIIEGELLVDRTGLSIVIGVVEGDQQGLRIVRAVRMVDSEPKLSDSLMSFSIGVELL